MEQKLIFLAMMLLIVPFAAALDPWVKAHTLPVCFGAKQNKYGSFHVPRGGKIAAVKLIHLSGYVTCTGQTSQWSFWGCGKHPSLKNYVGIAITTSRDTLLMPPNPLLTNHDGGAGKWSQLPGYNSFSPEIILPRSLPYPVSSGQELRLWYGQDLDNFSERNNAGLVCCNVYVLYV